MTYFHQFNPESSHVLWEDNSRNGAYITTRGKITTAAYKLTEDAVIFARGVLSTNEQNIPLWAIRDVDLTQSMAQKAIGVHDLLLNLDPAQAQGFGQMRVPLKSIKDARNVRELIMRQANAVRTYWYQVQQNRDVQVAEAGRSQVNIGVAHQADQPQIAAAPPPPPTAGPPAGWYTNPETGSGKRWWDGTAWTEHQTD